MDKKPYKKNEYSIKKTKLKQCVSDSEAIFMERLITWLDLG